MSRQAKLGKGEFHVADETFRNFNPLIKLHGYYMLSDYLEMPNLRRKATLWDLMAGRKRRPTGTRREVRSQIIYGAAAVLFSTADG